MTDKNYCMSSYLAFRYIEDDGRDFFDGIRHKNITPVSDDEKIPVRTAEDIGREMERQFEPLRDKRLGVLLSGGMDSAIAASYMKGSEAYTFRFLDGQFQKEELKRAETFAEKNNQRLHYVDINWETVEKYTDALMRAKSAPVHSIEPQIFVAAEQAKTDGIECMVIGESSDLIFGGMNLLIAKEWKLKEFAKRYTFLEPMEILKEPADMSYLYERYRKDNDGIDYLKFMDDVFAIESSSSYENAFSVANLSYFDPYAKLVMTEPLDLKRIRNGESKYLIRELFSIRYPNLQIPEKNPMPRPVDIYFKDWNGPKRPEFKNDIDMAKYTGNQKWQMWCLERFLNLNDKVIGKTRLVYESREETQNSAYS